MNMTSQGRSKQSKASEVGASPIQAHSEDTSANHTLTREEIKLRSYEIYLERGSLPGSELDDWLQAERQLDGRATKTRVDR
jgi:hypothetical protein